MVVVTVKDNIKELTDCGDTFLIKQLEKTGNQSFISLCHTNHNYTSFLKLFAKKMKLLTIHIDDSSNAIYPSSINDLFSSVFNDPILGLAVVL